MVSATDGNGSGMDRGESDPHCFDFTSSIPQHVVSVLTPNSQFYFPGLVVTR